MQQHAINHKFRNATKQHMTNLDEESTNHDDLQQNAIIYKFRNKNKLQKLQQHVTNLDEEFRRLL